MNTHIESEESEKSVAQALALLDAYFEAVNAMDAIALDKVFHNPNVHFSSSLMRILDTVDMEMDYFTYARQAGWHHSEWERRDILHAGSDKEHVAGRFKRLRADGSLISTHDVLMIVTCEAGKWGIKLRSNFL